MVKKFDSLFYWKYIWKEFLGTAINLFLSVVGITVMIGRRYSNPEGNGMTFYLALVGVALFLISIKAIKQNLEFTIPKLAIEFDPEEPFITNKTPLGQEWSRKTARIGIRNVTRKDLENCLVVLEEVSFQKRKYSPAIAFTTQNQKSQSRKGPFRLRPDQRKFVEIAHMGFGGGDQRLVLNLEVGEGGECMLHENQEYFLKIVVYGGALRQESDWKLSKTTDSFDFERIG